MALSKFSQLGEHILVEYVAGKEQPPQKQSYLMLKGKHFREILAIGSKSDLVKKRLVGLHNSAVPYMIPDELHQLIYMGDGEDSFVSTYKGYNLPVYEDAKLENLFVPYDVIRLHFNSGYIPDGGGAYIRVYADGDDGIETTFAHLVLNRNNLFRLGVQYTTINPNPMYFGSKVYDRYVEIHIPSVYKMSLDKGNPCHVKFLSDIRFAFSYIEDGNFELLDSLSPTTMIFGLDRLTVSSIPQASDADKFNAYLNVEDDYIEYYPTWGFSETKKVGTASNGEPIYSTTIPDPLTINIINAIESNSIPIYWGDREHINDGWEEFVDALGSNARRWVTVHELKMTEVYENDAPSGESTVEYKSVHSFTETYDTVTHTLNPEAYKYRYRPVVGLYSKNLSLVALHVVYTCRLMNRLNNTQIIRTASVSIPDPMKKFGYDGSRLDVSGLENLIIYNKIEKTEIQGQSTPHKMPNLKYEKVFYQSNDIMMNEASDGVYMPQGKIRIGMFTGEHLYKFAFISVKPETGESKRIDLSGAYDYILRFTDAKGNKIDLQPTYSKNMNPILGELEYRVMERDVKRIFHTNEPIFSIVVSTDNGSTTLVEGVAYKL